MSPKAMGKFVVRVADTFGLEESHVVEPDVGTAAMVKDSKRFADSGGWGYAQFDYDAVSETFRPADTSSSPPQEHDAECGFACHTIVADKDYVFTAYPKR